MTRALHILDRPLAPLVRRAGGVVRLVRPLNVVLFGVGVLVGAVLGAGEAALASRAVLLAALSAACVGAGGNALNDAVDAAVDRRNRPGRPIPAGVVGVRTARATWAVATVLGVGLGWAVSPLHGALAVAAAAALYAYDVRLKRTAGPGNVVVAALTALALVYGAAAAAGPAGVRAALVGAAFAGLTTLAREIAKDLEDAEGDAAEGVRTLPVVYGRAAAARLAAAVLLFTVALTPFPFLLPAYGGLYLLVVLCADGLLLHAVWLLRPADGAAAARASGAVKAAMGAGLAALALAHVG